MDQTEIFYQNTDIDEKYLKEFTSLSLQKLDDGELFLEYSESEMISFEDGTIKHANFDIDSGFGLRGIKGEIVSYSHSSVFDKKSLQTAAKTVGSIDNHTDSYNVKLDSSKGDFKKLYEPINPAKDISFAKKVEFLREVDSFIRSKSSKIRQVSVSIANNYRIIKIFRPDGNIYQDIRPLVRFNIAIVLEENGKMGSGSYGFGGRYSFNNIIDPSKWQKGVAEALRQAEINLIAEESPAGELPVVLGGGWPAVLLHEAIGHGLEGDFNRKKTSVFSEKMGQVVAAKGITIVDDGTLPNRRGSISIDDEGTISNCTTLIEDGVLVGFLQDRLNARLMNTVSTGNGRRESYKCAPLPRMTNTYMHAGTIDPSDIISSVKNGIYAVNFGGGQVDITSGKFVFSSSESYLIENGKITKPIKGASFIGSGHEVLKKITMIGNDLKLDEGIGTCGKEGQSVPVGVGQPTILIDGITVGGTRI